MVVDAVVSIDASSVNPPVSDSGTTDTEGRYILTGLPAGTEVYEILVTKDGYSSAQTYDRDIVSNPNPNPAHLSVFDGTTTTEFFEISPLANNLTIRTQTDSSKVTLCHHTGGGNPTTVRVSVNAVDTHLDTHGDFLGPCIGEWDETGDPLSIDFRLHGEKTIGTDSAGLPIYKYDANLTSDADGNYSIDNIEADSYDIIIDEVTTGYVVTGYSEQLPYSVLPASTQTITMDLADYEPYTALITVTDATHTIISDATVRLYTDDLSYDTTQVSYQYGQVFFAALDAQTYTIEISGTGYDTFSSFIEVDGNENQTVTLAAL